MGLVINILAAKFAIKEREVYLVKPFGVAQAPRREASGFGFFINRGFISCCVMRISHVVRGIALEADARPPIGVEGRLRRHKFLRVG